MVLLHVPRQETIIYALEFSCSINKEFIENCANAGKKLAIRKPNSEDTDGIVGITRNFVTIINASGQALFVATINMM